MNQFLKNAMQNDTKTWNGAVSNSTSGLSTLDYFAKCGSYRGRTLTEVAADMGSIFGSDPQTALKIVFYNRMVTRKAKGFVDTTDSVQKGQGQRDEFIKSLAWLENNRPDILKNNLWLVPVVGRWSDLWYDSAATGYFHYVNTDWVYHLIKHHGLESEYQRGLLAKYLPKIRSRSNIKTERHKRLNAFAKGLCSYLGWSEKKYRKFKSNPENTAHIHQRIMCAGEWNELDFNRIPGKALFNMLGQKGKDRQNAIERHGLSDKYLEWIKSQPVAKFTGYPYELYNAAKGHRSAMQKFTFDAQFEQLIKTAKDSVPAEVLDKGVLCALDTSGSMSGGYGMGGIQNAGLAPIDVCVGLGIYFSRLLQGAFADHVIMFDNVSRFLKLNGTFCDRVDQIGREATAWGGTNFQSVIDEIVRVRRQNPGVPVSDFPQVLLVVSDMQFNPTGTWSGGYSNAQEMSNYNEAKRKLASVGLPEMSFIWWQVNGRFTGDVPSTMFDAGTTLISGFDGAIVTTLLGGMEEVVDKVTGEVRKPTPDEMMAKALDQEILNHIRV